MRKVLALLLAASMMLPFLTACGSKNKSEATKKDVETVVMVYMMGSDLESKAGAGSDDLSEMEESGIDLDSADIEGGGRVLLATKKGKFKIPKDADKGLIYIGLDKDFNVITDPTFR